MENRKLNIIVVGAGMGGCSLIEIFKDSETVNIVGVIDINTEAPGIHLAQKYGIPTSTTWEEFICLETLDEIFDVTGSYTIFKQLIKTKPEHVGIIGGPSAKMIWQLLEERTEHEQELKKKLEELEKFLKFAVNRELTMVELKKQ
ncbi:MAG: hypothetical protein ABH862_00815 [Candidatus Omnitrophota bacterium]